jgi:signal transduction histidine kinase
LHHRASRLTAGARSRRNCSLATAEELRSLLARAVAAGDAERRRFERELHDGAQQELIALAVNLQLARRLADSDSEATKRLLEELARDVHDALDRVRELATAIYPPLLTSRGLADALKAAGVRVRVDGGTLPRFAPEVEAGFYFFCLALAQAPASDEEIPPAASDRIFALGGRMESSGGTASGSIPAQPLSAR